MLSQRAIRGKQKLASIAPLVAASAVEVSLSPSTAAHLFDPLRRGVGSGAGFPAFTALRMAISANISGPLPSTAASSVSAAISHSGCLSFALGNACMYSPAFFGLDRKVAL